MHVHTVFKVTVVSSEDASKGSDEVSVKTAGRRTRSRRRKPKAGGGVAEWSCRTAIYRFGARAQPDRWLRLTFTIADSRTRSSSRSLSLSLSLELAPSPLLSPSSTVHRVRSPFRRPLARPPAARTRTCAPLAPVHSLLFLVALRPSPATRETEKERIHRVPPPPRAQQAHASDTRTRTTVQRPSRNLFLRGPRGRSSTVTGGEGERTKSCFHRTRTHREHTPDLTDFSPSFEGLLFWESAEVLRDCGLHGTCWRRRGWKGWLRTGEVQRLKSWNFLNSMNFCGFLTPLG